MKIKDYYIDKATDGYEFDDETGKWVKEIDDWILTINSWNRIVVVKLNRVVSFSNITDNLLKEIIRLSEYVEGN